MGFLPGETLSDLICLQASVKELKKENEELRREQHADRIEHARFVSQEHSHHQP